MFKYLVNNGVNMSTLVAKYVIKNLKYIQPQNFIVTGIELFVDSGKHKEVKVGEEVVLKAMYNVVKMGDVSDDVIFNDIIQHSELMLKHVETGETKTIPFTNLKISKSVEEGRYVIKFSLVIEEVEHHEAWVVYKR